VNDETQSVSPPAPEPDSTSSPQAAPAPLEPSIESTPEAASEVLALAEQSASVPPVDAPINEAAQLPTPPPAVSAESSIVAHRAEALEKRKANRNAKLEKIVAYANLKRRVTNNDVQMLLRVSDATATRYLSELVRAGRLKRIGAPKRPTYEPA